jgi:hypothetical protein
MPRVVLHSDTTGREDGFAINGTQVGKDTLYASATDTVILNSIKRKQSVLSDTNAGWLEKIDVLDSIISAGTHDSGETIPGLSLSLKSGDVLTRQLAARVIGMQKNIDSEMRNSLVSALSDEKSEVRIEAIKALGSLACKDSVVMNLINQKCNTGTLEERQIAEHTLTYSMRDMPFEWLKDVYEQNKSLRLRAGAIRMIGEKILDKRELRTKLIKTALNDSNLIIKLAGMDAVVNSSFKDSLLINDAAIISVLKKFILGDNIELGEKAAETIMNAHILGTGVTDVLVDGLNSTKFSIAAKCAEALGQEIRIDDHSTEALIKHLQSNNADVVTATANSLINRKNYNRFYGEILATLNSSSITTQENGLKILANDAEIKLEQNTIDKVVMLLKDKNTSLKASALNVIIKHNIMNVEISKLLFSIIDNPQVERVPFSKATEILNKNENINRLDRKTILYYLKNGKQTDTKTTCIEILDRRQEFDAEIVDILSDALKEALKKAQNDIFSVSTAFSSDPVGQSAKEILKKISQKSNLDPSLKKKIENILQVAP